MSINKKYMEEKFSLIFGSVLLVYLRIIITLSNDDHKGIDNNEKKEEEEE